MSAVRSLPHVARLRAVTDVVFAIAYVVVLSVGGTAAIVRRAAAIPEAAHGLEGFVNAARRYGRVLPPV